MKFDELLRSKIEEIDNESKKVLDSVYATLGFGLIILIVLLGFIITGKDITDDDKKMFSIFFVVLYVAVFILCSVAGSIKSKKILKKKDKVEKQLKDEKKEKKDIMFMKQVQKVKDDNFKL